MRNCERCNGEVSWTSDMVKLRGGALVHFCTVCHREWNRLCVAQFRDEDVQVMARIKHLNALAKSGNAPPEEEWLEVDRKLDLLDVRAESLSADFIAKVTNP